MVCGGNRTWAMYTFEETPYSNRTRQLETRNLPRSRTSDCIICEGYLHKHTHKHKNYEVLRILQDVDTWCSDIIIIVRIHNKVERYESSPDIPVEVR